MMLSAEHQLRRSVLLRRLNITFTYAMPAVGDDRGRKMNATQVAVLKVRKVFQNIFLASAHMPGDPFTAVILLQLAQLSWLQGIAFTCCIDCCASRLQQTQPRAELQPVGLAQRCLHMECVVQVNA